MASVKKPTTFLSLPVEVQRLVFENLHSQEETLYLSEPRPKNNTIEAVRAADTTVHSNLTAFEADRLQLKSVLAKYTTCKVTFSSDRKLLQMPRKGDRPNITHLLITIDDLAIDGSYNANNKSRLQQKFLQVRNDIKHFVEWTKSLPKALESIQIRFTESYEQLGILETAVIVDDNNTTSTVISALLEPFLDLPKCRNTIVKQAKEKSERFWAQVDDGEEPIFDLEYQGEWVVHLKFAVQGWIKGWRNKAERDSFQAMYGPTGCFEFEVASGRRGELRNLHEEQGFMGDWWEYDGVDIIMT